MHVNTTYPPLIGLSLKKYKLAKVIKTIKHFDFNKKCISKYVYVYLNVTNECRYFVNRYLFITLFILGKNLIVTYPTKINPVLILLIILF